MTAADRVAFARAFYAMGEAFSEPVSDLKAEAYFDALSDLAAVDVLGAMRAAIRTCKFFPRPVELREQIQGNPQDRAEIAWQDVLRLIRVVGGHQEPGEVTRYGTLPTWPDEASRRAALELFGGWALLCELLPGGGPELIGWAKQFKAAYVAYHRRDGALPALPPPTRDEARQLLASIAPADDAVPLRLERPPSLPSPEPEPVSEWKRLRAELAENRAALSHCAPEIDS